MAIKTMIEYCDSTINPSMGCTGCELYPDHCYAATLCHRYAGRKGWPKDFSSPEYFHGRLEKAIRWPDLTGTDRPDKPWLNGKPRVIFVNDLSDGFCPDVDPGGWLWPRLEAMENSPHIWLLLTKWPDRMADFFVSIGGAPDNSWVGTSILRPRVSWRVKQLRRIKASVHWLSLEPLLDYVFLSIFCDAKDCWAKTEDNVCAGCARSLDIGVDWVIVGGESGPGARPMRPDWVRGIRDQCQAAGVPFFFKQWGAWAHIPSDTRKYPHAAEKHWWSDQNLMARVGKKAAGRLLDGIEWNEFPA
jgi:protein gp37